MFKKSDISKFIVFTFLITILLSAADASHEGIGIKIARLMNEKGLSPYLIIFIISMIPVVELRGAIPIGILFFKLHWGYVLFASIVGNMIPIFFVLFIFKFVEKFLRRFRIFNRFFDWLFSRTLAKSKSVEKYQELGLTFFVGIPLPITGAWTGSLIAYLLKLSYIKSIIFIFIGVLVAAIIVSVITFFKIIGLIIAISIFIIIMVIGFIRASLDKK